MAQLGRKHLGHYSPKDDSFWLAARSEDRLNLDKFGEPYREYVQRVNE